MRHIPLILCVVAVLLGFGVAALAQDTPAYDEATLTILIRARSDLEILVDQQMGVGARPVGWTGSLDINNPQLPILIRSDLDLLMATLVGLDHIPAGWFGAQPSTVLAIARDIRHDLEHLADAVVGFNVRPPGWSGDNPLMRCDRSTQNLVVLLQRNNLYSPDVLTDNPDYCRLLTNQVSQFTEVNLLTQETVTALNPESAESGDGAGAAAPAGDRFFPLPNITLTFLDRYATRRVNNMPQAVSFTPVARSFTQFSHMTLVRGDGFEVFVDYATTTLDANRFARLPDVNLTAANPHCDAEWCGPERRIAGMGSRANSQGLVTVGLVSATNNIIIYYDGEDQDGMTRVRIKLCDRDTDTPLAICEPVTDVIRPDGSTAVPVGTVDGLLQFYVPYTYSTTSVHTANFHTADLWIRPPD